MWNPSDPYNTISSTIESVVFTGKYYPVYANVDGTQPVNAELDLDTEIKIGDKRELHVCYKDAIILKAEGDPFADRIKELLEGKAAAD